MSKYVKISKTFSNYPGAQEDELASYRGVGNQKKMRMMVWPISGGFERENKEEGLEDKQNYRDDKRGRK